MKHPTPVNLKRKSEQDKKRDSDIKNSHDFFKKPGDNEALEHKLKKELQHIKTDDAYVEPIVQDTETIEKETKKKDNEFFKLALKFSEFDSAAIEQKKPERIIDLFDYLEIDKPQVIDDELKIQDIFIDDDYLFEISDEHEIKDISTEMLIDQNEILFEDLPKPKIVVKYKSLEKLKKIKPNKNLERLPKKNKKKIPQTKTEKRCHKKGQQESYKLVGKSQLFTNRRR